jgi:Mrp family chromosome partitioning ATPase
MSTAVTGVDKIRRALELARTMPAPTLATAPARATGPASATGESVVPVDRRPEPAAAIRTREAVVDRARLRRERILLPEDTGPAAQAVKLLRTQVLQLMARNGCRSLAIVSPTSGDGRTITAINLAASIADDPDHTSLLVDLDLRGPTVGRRFGIAVDQGIESCLRGSADVEAALVRPAGFRKLTLLPAAQPATGSAELLAADATRRLTREINRRYANRVALYDLPPLLETADALAFLPCVDAALLVVSEGRTRREDVVRSLQLMRDTPVVGTVLNASREPRGL